MGKTFLMLQGAPEGYNPRMMNVVLLSLASVIGVSLLSLVGILFFLIDERFIGKVLLYFVSFSTGALLGDVFIHIIPEMADEPDFFQQGLLIVLLGILVSFMIEKIIHWRHCHIPTSENHPHPVGAMNLIGDGLHNFFDGALIAGSFLVDVHLGIATTIAVILHEIPQEIGDFGILIHAGYSKAKALSWNFFSALTAFLGVIIVFVIGQQAADSFGLFVVPITAGGFIYIAVSDLLPEMRKETRWQHSLLQLLQLGSSTHQLQALIK
jgi:zinc and cadmium transporter